MPVTIRPQPEKTGINADPVTTSSAHLLETTSKAWTVDAATFGDDVQTNKKLGPEDRKVLKTSFGDLDGQSSSKLGLVAYGNGFVEGILRAFQQDLHLVLRPDDVWLAIMTQFSFYVNGHAEELRSTFVSHDEKKIIGVNMMPATLEQISIDEFCEKVVAGMQGFLADEGLAEWLLPRFSTTTAWTKRMLMGCGFPSVTLLGEKADWEDLRARLARFARYGDEPAEWVVYVDKAVEMMVRSFDSPDDTATKQFWMRACHAAGKDGSLGVETLSGWLTAFCFWNADGKKIYNYPDVQPSGSWLMDTVDRKRLVLDGVSFPVIARSSVPKAVSDVPVIVDDAGTGLRYHTTMVAGSVGMEGSRVDDSEGSGITTFQPRSGWWMLLDKTEGVAKELS